MRRAAAAAAVPAILPSRMFGRTPPSDTMLLGCIGVGRQGIADMQEAIYRGLEAGARVAAVCDVDSHRLEDAQWLAEKIYDAELGNGGRRVVDAYEDYRDLLTREDIDAVIIVTPDHWHGKHGIDAVRAGKDIYLEKPLTYSIGEGRELVKAVRENGRILQVGTHQRSFIYFQIACELVLNERLGKLKRILVTLPPDTGRGDPRPMPVPRNLNYDFWLGPAPEAPFTEDRVHPHASYDRPGWIQIESYCLGMITGWGAHMNDIAQWGNGPDDAVPVEIEAKGEFPDRGLFDVHTNFHGEALYANGVRLVMETGDPPGVRFEGDLGWIFVNRNELKASDREILRREAGDGGIKLSRSTNHMRNFLDAVRGRKDPVSPVETGHHANTIGVMTHIAMKLGRKLRWDPRAERFLDDDEANSRLDYPHRRPWTL